jgi:DNA-binding HxlR family transcriptional regulator
VHSQMPPRTSYELAPAGVDLQRVIDAIGAWAREHLAVAAEEEPSAAVG